jgi:hypothetical protein
MASCILSGREICSSEAGKTCQSTGGLFAAEAVELLRRFYAAGNPAGAHTQLRVECVYLLIVFLSCLFAAEAVELPHTIIAAGNPAGALARICCSSCMGS